MVCARFVRRCLGKEKELVHLQATLGGDTGTEHITGPAPGGSPPPHLQMQTLPEMHSTSLAPTFMPCACWQEHGGCVCTYTHTHRHTLIDTHSSTHICVCTSFYPGW